MDGLGLDVRGGGPEGFPFLVVKGDGTPVAALPLEADAERFRVLWASWAASRDARRVLRSGLTAAEPAERPAFSDRPTGGGRAVEPGAPGYWDGASRPEPGKVYRLGYGGEPARAVESVQRPEPAAAVAVPDGVPADLEPAPEAPRVLVEAGWAGEVRPSTWTGPHGSTVSDLGGGRFAVAFDRRPRPEVRDVLKAARFRWVPALGRWEGVALPSVYRLR